MIYFFLVSSLFAFALSPAKAVVVVLKNGSGKQVGTATINEQKNGVKLQIQVEGLSPGEHAIHFHEKGLCTAPDFKSAGAHFSRPGQEHGFDHTKGPHSGDMRNFTVGADGRASVALEAEFVSIKGASSLLRKGGTSLVIHAKPDDYKSQPAGDSGDRIACGEIRGS